MTLDEFITQSISHVNWGWRGVYATYLLAKFNDRKEAANIFNRCKLVAYRSAISIGDARHSLISHGKI